MIKTKPNYKFSQCGKREHAKLIKLYSDNNNNIFRTMRTTVIITEYRIYKRMVFVCTSRKNNNIIWTTWLIVITFVAIVLKKNLIQFTNRVNSSVGEFVNTRAVKQTNDFKTKHLYKVTEFFYNIYDIFKESPIIDIHCADSKKPLLQIMKKTCNSN